MKRFGKDAHAGRSNACARLVMTVQKPLFGRAARLLTKLLDRGMDPHALAAALMITTRQMDKYRTGRFVMPLDRQLCLAVFATRTAPDLARDCRALRAQVAAAASFHAGKTAIHDVPPPTRAFAFPAPPAVTDAVPPAGHSVPGSDESNMTNVSHP